MCRNTFRELGRLTLGLLAVVLVAGPTGPCTPCVEMGGTCAEDGDCCDGLVCNSAGQCAEPCAPAGGPCTATADCCAGLICETGGTCQSPPQTQTTEKSDLWTTNTLSTSEQSFSQSPIPAGFLGDDCDPFDGAASFAGAVLNENTTGMADTVVHRSGDPISPSDPVGAVGTVEVQITGLNLWSTEPVTVACGGQPTQWNIHATLSDTPSPTGSLTAIKTHSNGGTATTVLPVLMKLIFSRVDDPATQRVLDFATAGLDPIEFTAELDWVHYLDPANPDPASSFIVGVAGGPEAARAINQGKPENIRRMSPDGETLIVCSEHAGPGHVHNTCKTDTDGDGIPDGIDICRYQYDPDQQDRDGDRFGDACDPCPDDPLCPQSGGECEGLCTDLYLEVIDIWSNEYGAVFCQYMTQCTGFAALNCECSGLLNDQMDVLERMMCVWTEFLYTGCDRCSLEQIPFPDLPCDIPGVTNDPCANVTCPSGQICDALSGTCVEDPCAGITCPPGQTCSGGVCMEPVDPCDSITCPAGMTCSPATYMCWNPQTGECASLFPDYDQCEYVTCPAGQTCDSDTGCCCDPVTGECESPYSFDLCEYITCPAGQTCDGNTGYCCDPATGECGPPEYDLCSFVTCPDGQTCDPQTGACQ